MQTCLLFGNNFQSMILNQFSVVVNLVFAESIHVPVQVFFDQVESHVEVFFWDDVSIKTLLDKMPI